MGSQHDDADLTALMGYIKELENRLAKKDEMLAAKDQRIGSLEAEVTVMKSATTSAAPVFRARAKAQAELVTPRVCPDAMASTPTQVSDDSGEIEPASQTSLSHSLSHISQAHSSDEEDSSTEQTSDGRWNIPFDGSFEDLRAKSSSGKGSGHENALKDIGFIPISQEGHERFSGEPGGLEATPVRPVARSYGATSFAQQAVAKGLLNDAANEKENYPSKRSLSPGISTSRGITFRSVR